jgi:hypothetical protein
VIKLVLAWFTGVHVDLFQRLSVNPASVSAVAIGSGPPRILCVNDTGELGDLAEPRTSTSRRRSTPKLRG